MEKNDPASALNHAEEPLTNKSESTALENTENEKLIPMDADVIPAEDDKLVNEAAELAKDQTADAPAEEPLLAEGADIIPEQADKLVNEAAELDGADNAPSTFEEVIEQAKALRDSDPADISRDAINRLRSAFNNLSHKNSTEETEAQAQSEANPEEEAFKEILNEIKTQKAEFNAKLEQQRADNLLAKKDIIAQIIALAEDTDNVNRTFPK